MTPLSKRVLRITGIAAMILGLAMGALMMVAAWGHNPSGVIHSNDCIIVWNHWLLIGFSGFIVVGVFVFIIFGLIPFHMIEVWTRLEKRRLIPKFSVKRLLIAQLIIILLIFGGLCEYLKGPILFRFNQEYVGLFRKRFPNATYYSSGGIGIKGLAAKETVAIPNHFLEVELDLSYIPSRTALVVNLNQRVKERFIAIRDRLTFESASIREILENPIDEKLFEKYPSCYPKVSPIPEEWLKER